MSEQVFNEAKFKELVLYLAGKCKGDPNFGAIKLNKTLFFSDFFAYAELGTSITGSEYIRLDYGPAPRLMSAIRDEMEAQGDIRVISRTHFDLTQRRIIPRREAARDVFTDNELSKVDSVVESVRNLNATELSELAHNLLGWRIAADRQVIPYETIFLFHAPVTEDDSRQAATLAQCHNW